MIEYNEVDDSSGGNSKLVEKSSKIQELLKSPKSLKSLKNLQRPLVWRNVYQTTNPLLVHKCEELRQSFNSFSNSFYKVQKLSQYYFTLIINKEAADILSYFFKKEPKLNIQILY